MDVEPSNDSIMEGTICSSRNKKRQHPDSSALAASRPKTSMEILQLVENPNFEELARHYPAFQNAWNAVRQRQKETQGSFSSCITQEFTISLTRGLLQGQFRLKLPYLESNHLCPPVPNRFFYIHWLRTSVLSHPQKCQSSQQTTKGLWGMDIGTGATCIYPLLASRFMGDCNMVGTDIDMNALALAKKNVEANHMTTRIHLLHVLPSHSQDPTNLKPGGPLLRSIESWYGSTRPNHHHQQQLDFVMTNPPFYDPNEMEESSSPHATPRVGDGRDRTAMTVSEGNYPGGEVGFVTEMLVDSLKSPRSSKWYSSMLGKKASLIKLQKLLTRVLGPAHVHATEYGPGQYTRWFLAWTLEQPATLSPLARIEHAGDKFQVTLLEHGSIDSVSEVATRIRSFCETSPGGWDLEMIESSTPTTNSAVLMIKEAMPLAITNFVDESMSNANIPEDVLLALQQVQNNSSFLPDEGHFVIQVRVARAVAAENKVSVQLECYAHSSRGIKAIEKIRNTIEGEINRTNRKWRRIRQRQQNGNDPSQS